ncbi:MAG: kelch repeat-containing protein [Armatimonadota bacterium]|nr:kelch repeat-containing protein [Armatimonadota bacterium]
MMKKVFVVAVVPALLFLRGIAQAEVIQVAPGVTANHTIAHLSQARSELTGATAGNRAYFAGGYNPQSPYVSALDVYDAGTGQWSQAAPLTSQEGKRYISAASVGNRAKLAALTLSQRRGCQLSPRQVRN